MHYIDIIFYFPTLMKCCRSTAENTNIMYEMVMVSNRFVSGLVLFNVSLCAADCTGQRVGHCCNILYIFFPTSFSSFLYLPNDSTVKHLDLFSQCFHFFFFCASIRWYYSFKGIVLDQTCMYFIGSWVCFPDTTVTITLVFFGWKYIFKYIHLAICPSAFCDCLSFPYACRVLEPIPTNLWTMFL